MTQHLPSFAKPGLGKLVQRLAEAVRTAGGRALLVGGSVRDHVLGQVSQDADLEVYGLSPEALEGVLSAFGTVRVVGRRFAVLHLATPAGVVEVSLPRRESKTGPGHKGFAVTADPGLDPRSASRRRDFTVNAMLLDPLTGDLLDPWDGRTDLRKARLRHVSPAFAEDPLRVMRAGRFVARFGWRVDPDTARLCRKLDLSELPRERLEAEWRQVLLRGRFPGRGLAALEQVGALRFFPEVAALRNVPQDPLWHPEGEVFHHTCLALDAAVHLRDEMADPWVEMLGVLCHDFGKAATTVFQRGRWRSPDHDRAGEQPARAFLARITRQDGVADQVAALVREHLRPMQLYKARERVSDAAVRRLAMRADIPAVVRVALADGAGRGTPFEREWPAGEWLLERAERLGVRDQRPRPLLWGRDLLELGMPPGREMGRVLEEAFELQLDGALCSREEALAWAGKRLGDTA